MKKYTSFFVVIVIVSSFLFSFSASAAVFKTGDQVTIGDTPDDLYTSGGTVSISGNVTGDLYVVGGSVTHKGNVAQDLTIAGGTVIVDGTVGDDAILAGGTVTLRSTVKGDVFIGGGSVQILEGTINGNVYAGGGTIRLEAPVRGSVRIGGGDIYINAPINGKVEIDGGKLILGSKAVISGDLTYRMPQEATIESGAQIIGRTIYEHKEYGQKFNSLAKARWGFVTIANFLIILVSAMIFGLFFKRYAHKISENVADRPWTQLFRGVVAVILLPILSILLLVTIVGIPLGILGLLSFVSLIIFSGVMSSVVLGTMLYRWIYAKKEFVVDWKSILFGVISFTLLSFIPVIGWAVQLVLVLMTLSSAIDLKWQVAKEWR